MGNLLGDGPTLIDFEYAQVADPLYDLALLVTYYPELEGRTRDLGAAMGLGALPDQRDLPLWLAFSHRINRLWGLALD